MSIQSMTVQAVFQNGVLLPSEPLPLKAKQKVTITVQWPTSEPVWPKNAAEIFRELVEEDRSLAEQMRPLVEETWLKEGG